MSVPDENGWRSIETAPRETLVQVYCPWVDKVAQGRFTQKYHWHSPEPGWRVAFGLMKAVALSAGLEPTHWQPLPKPPVQP